MMNAHVANLLNEQINKEFYSAYLYLDFANYFERTGLAGFANYFKVQAEEEKSARDLIAKVEQFASDARGGLYLLDQELAARVYTAPVQA